MPLMPKRVKHRKVQRGSRAGLASTNTALAFGEYGLKNLGRGWLTATQIELVPWTNGVILLILIKSCHWLSNTWLKNAV